MEEGNLSYHDRRLAESPYVRDVHPHQVPSVNSQQQLRRLLWDD